VRDVARTLGRTEHAAEALLARARAAFRRTYDRRTYDRRTQDREGGRDA
jgi:hypothetical protein